MKTTEDFIKEIKLVHGEIYDYSKLVYSGCANKVDIICIEHGQFSQKASGHLDGQGCPKCASVVRAKSIKLTTEIFIHRAISIHGMLYDYSEVNYKNYLTKVKIKCKTHGIFLKDVKSHLRGSGCSECLKITTDEFLKRAKNVHGDLYDYSESVYETRRKKLIIKCKKHGNFFATPENHIDGKTGCPNCFNSKGENKISNILEINKINFLKQYKFQDCKNKFPLKFDFFLPDFKICIEYDGQQHFSSKWLGIKSFNQTKINDSIKDEYCKINNIPLLRIRFDDKNLEEKIIKFL